MAQDQTETWVLLSGGLDSLACVAYYASRGHSLRCLFIDYGQRAAEQERLAVEQISAHLGLTTVFASVAGAHFNAGEIPGRNLLLVSTALTVRGVGPGLIAIGIHSGTPYADCTPAFIERTQAVIDLSSGGSVQLDAPFLKMSKTQVFSEVKKGRLPVDLTYSCEQGGEAPCGACLSCLDRAMLRV